MTALTLLLVSSVMPAGRPDDSWSDARAGVQALLSDTRISKGCGLSKAGEQNLILVVPFVPAGTKLWFRGKRRTTRPFLGTKERAVRSYLEIYALTRNRTLEEDEDARMGIAGRFSESATSFDATLALRRETWRVIELESRIE